MKSIVFKKILTILAFVILAVPFAPPAAAEEDCRLQLIAELPIVPTRDNRVIVPALINGKPVQLMIDTGAPTSIIDQAAVDRLGLKPHLITSGMRFTFFGGERMSYYVRDASFTLGTMTAPKVQFLISSDRSPEHDGILGLDFLMQFDVDFDIAGGKVNLFAPHRCANRAVYWTQDDAAVAILPFTMSEYDRHLRIHTKINGRDIDAVFDTGAGSTRMNLETADVWFGVNDKSPGIEDLDDGVYAYRFDTLSLEGVTVKSPEVVLETRENTKFPNFEILLSMSVLRQLHFLISFKERQIYITGASAK